MASRPVIPIIAGPTAVGKTQTSIRVATALNAEIISADSRQIYTAFQIVTACPTSAELAHIPHHLIRELDLSEDYSAGKFAARLLPVVHSVRAREKSVVVSGGSTLYVHALLEGLSDIPPVDPSIRDTLNKRLAEEGAAALYAELVAVDPVFAQSLDETKSQRIIRGLEIWLGTGRPLSGFHTAPPLPEFDFRLFVLHRERQKLYKRIDARVDQMVEEGLLKEAESVYGRYHGRDLNSLRTIGYQELVPYFEGTTSLDEAIGLIKRNSRRYAKRQLTWYKRYQNAVWIDVDSEDAAVQIAKSSISN